ncbi:MULTISPECIES: hypothetical protein [unclassified Solwaraspora]|uniref:hypothetical protein n=1 Tax=unclassified Solwaraspora TaxID=2627926 RepID=UPI00248AD63C|nr:MULTISPECIES: hypothetical protein [unclassified Solwaraspora]WBB98353.1 hypothetical protein O7553_05335 [Solwaraspora sp. WMMA2059]WBC23094.1 hypothetical protein O7543_12030 [Solwaraspora sp. WMMA2080]WJK34839.1 hypothetical protein O7610_30495 [Solwaraspora sp. WMMA2065]WJK34871.1 hypothetical protein O7610_00180 [Solwaraspora sp. WMMA2065]
MNTDTDDDPFTGSPPPGAATTGQAEAEAERIESRAGHLLPEEEAAGSDDPVRQAAAILDDSDRREQPRPQPGSEPPG